MSHLLEQRGASADFFAPRNNKYPFSEAVRVGQTIYLAGQIGIGPDGLVAGFEPQMRQMMNNVASTLKGMGLGMEHLVKCTVFMRDMSKWQAFNDIYLEYFDSAVLPARSAFGTPELALGAEAEIECIAYAPEFIANSGSKASP